MATMPRKRGVWIASLKKGEQIIKSWTVLKEGGEDGVHPPK